MRQKKREWGQITGVSKRMRTGYMERISKMTRISKKKRISKMKRISTIKRISESKIMRRMRERRLVSKNDMEGVMKIVFRMSSTAKRRRIRKICKASIASKRMMRMMSNLAKRRRISRICKVSILSKRMMR